MDGRVEADQLNRAEAASLLGWWLEAGVDVPIQEEARDWRRLSSPLPLAGGEEARSAEGEGLSPNPSRKQQAHPQPLLQAGGERPQTFDAFHAWLAETADLPLFRAGAARALPHGPAEAELMLLTGIPSPEDVAEGRPIGGMAYDLTERMLAAIGFKPEQVYVAALTCFSGTGSRFSPQETEACRETVLAQIALAAPRRLLLLGDAPAKLLLGQSMAQARGRIHRIGGVPAAVTFPPRHLLQNSGHKALAWTDLLLLMGEQR